MKPQRAHWRLEWRSPTDGAVKVAWCTAKTARRMLGAVVTGVGRSRGRRVYFLGFQVAVVAEHRAIPRGHSFTPSLPGAS